MNAGLPPVIIKKLNLKEQGPQNLDYAVLKLLHMPLEHLPRYDLFSLKYFHGHFYQTSSFICKTQKLFFAVINHGAIGL